VPKASAASISIAAAKVLRTPVVAGDLDPEAVTTARGNARLNGLGHQSPQAAERGAVMAGAEGKRRLDLDGEVVPPHLMTVMAAMDEEAARPHRHELKRRRPAHVLDVGTGTGILGFAAAKVLRTPVVGEVVPPHLMTVMAAMDEEAARPHRLQPLERGAHPILLVDGLENRFDPMETAVAAFEVEETGAWRLEAYFSEEPDAEMIRDPRARRAPNPAGRWSRKPPRRPARRPSGGSGRGSSPRRAPRRNPMLEGLPPHRPTHVLRLITDEPSARAMTELLGEHGLHDPFDALFMSNRAGARTHNSTSKTKDA
jgi:FMN phosphatase YigB (HAD superfamily)